MITIYNSSTRIEKLILERAIVEPKEPERYGEDKIVTLQGETIIHTNGNPDGSSIIKEYIDLVCQEISQTEFDSLKLWYRNLQSLTIIDQRGQIWSGFQVIGRFGLTPIDRVDGTFYYKGTLNLEL